MWDNFYIPMKYWAEFFPIIFGFLILYLSFLNLYGFLRILLFSFNNFICRNGLMFMLVFCKYWQDRIIARLQQPYSLDCIPVEAEYQVGHSMIVCFCNTVDRNFFFSCNCCFQKLSSLHVCIFTCIECYKSSLYCIPVKSEASTAENTFSCQVAIRNFCNQKPRLLLHSHKLMCCHQCGCWVFVFSDLRFDHGDDF
jgi:hypothetical protein